MMCWHCCIDVWPFIHKANGNTDYRNTYKQYRRACKQAGYKTPKQAPVGA